MSMRDAFVLARADDDLEIATEFTPGGGASPAGGDNPVAELLMDLYLGLVKVEALLREVPENEYGTITERLARVKYVAAALPEEATNTRRIGFVPSKPPRPPKKRRAGRR